MNRNPLYPVFFRMDKLKLLIVGAGQVGEEKLHFILKSSPNAHITVIAPEIAQKTKEVISKPKLDVTYISKKFEPNDIDSHDIVVAATNIPEVNQQVYKAAKSKGKIVNIADTPDLCDFYMGSIVTKGDVKVAISTNGKSPTFAKRFRQWLEATLPDETAELVNTLKLMRDKLSMDFEEKVKELNRITKSLSPEKDDMSDEL